MIHAYDNCISEMFRYSRSKSGSAGSGVRNEAGEVSPGWNAKGKVSSDSFCVNCTRNFRSSMAAGEEISYRQMCPLTLSGMLVEGPSIA